MKGHDGDGYSFEIKPPLELLRVERVGEFAVSCAVNFSINRMLVGVLGIVTISVHVGKHAVPKLLVDLVDVAEVHISSLHHPDRLRRDLSEN